MSPTDSVMSPVTRGLLARTRRPLRMLNPWGSSKVRPHSWTPPCQIIESKDVSYCSIRVGPLRSGSVVEIDESLAICIQSTYLLDAGLLFNCWLSQTQRPLQAKFTFEDIDHVDSCRPWKTRSRVSFQSQRPWLLLVLPPCSEYTGNEQVGCDICSDRGAVREVNILPPDVEQSLKLV